jgi:hypothetical protein
MLPVLALAHPGGLDNAGGHTNKTTGAYHCHRDGCELQEAEGRPVTLLYDRDDWRHWTDADGDCMNTRHEILLEQADGPVKLSPDRCYVSVGRWEDPFSGKVLTRASDLDVDHIEPLKWAHGHGGDRWTLEQKEHFANDHANLLAVDDNLNQQKGAKGPDEWLPPNHAYRCEYLAAWQRVLAIYPDLRMTPAEARVFKRQLGACGNQFLE